jgi:cytochrome P450 family 3 subfamily A
MNSIFMGTRPILIVADPQLIKDMNIKDFHIFVDHNDITAGDPLSDRSLFNLFGDEWKKLRSIVRLFYSLLRLCFKTFLL